jgi:hypothetical protein
MKSYSYRILAAAVAGLCAGVVGAQTYGDSAKTMPNNDAPASVQTPAPGSAPNASASTARLPARKGATDKTPAQVEPASPPTDKMSGQEKTSEQDNRTGMSGHHKMSASKPAGSMHAMHRASKDDVT